jgi:hypothetical protein
MHCVTVTVYISVQFWHKPFCFVLAEFTLLENGHETLIYMVQ